MSIKVECTVQVLELGRKEIPPSNEQPKILVRNHWNRSQLVVLKIGDQDYTVNGRDLITAIENAMRSNQ